MNDPIRLLLVGGEDMLPGGVQAMLPEGANVTISAIAHSEDEAVGLCGAERPDVVLLDMDLGELDGIETTRRLREASPDSKILVVAALQSPQSIAFALASGACGFLPRIVPTDLEAILRRAAAGEMVMPVTELGPVLEQLGGRRSPLPSAQDSLGRLTVRETEILTSLAAGDSTLEIAERLGISRLTVQSHVKSILAKLGVHSKVEAVTLAWRHGLAPVSRTA